MNLSFIKLDINILDDNKIKLIRKYPDGDKLLILWLGLLCMAMKSETPGNAMGGFLMKLPDGHIGLVV